MNFQNIIMHLYVYIFNNILSITTIIIALIALFQTHKQIKLSNKQSLFNRRLEKYILSSTLIKLYEDTRTILNYDKSKDDEGILVSMQFIELTNTDYLKDITCIIEEPKNYEYKVNFLYKIEELKKISTEISLIFKKEKGQLMSNFIYEYQNLLMELYRYQIVLDEMITYNKKNHQEYSFKELRDIFGEKRFREKMFMALDKADDSYNKIISKNILNKIRKDIKL